MSQKKIKKALQPHVKFCANCEYFCSTKSLVLQATKRKYKKDMDSADDFGLCTLLSNMKTYPNFPNVSVSGDMVCEDVVKFFKDKLFDRRLNGSS